MNTKNKFILAAIIIILAAASRLVKHPFNFTPIIAMSIFAGCYLKKYWALIIPLASMFLSDLFIGLYDFKLMLPVYLSIVFAYFIGYLLSKRKTWYNIFFSAIFSSVAFFIITNLAFWLFFNYYSHNFQGLINCFTLAIPFFRNSLAGDIIYSSVLFGVYESILIFINKYSLVKITKND